MLDLTYKYKPFRTDINDQVVHKNKNPNSGVVEALYSSGSSWFIEFESNETTIYFVKRVLKGAWCNINNYIRYDKKKKRVNN